MPSQTFESSSASLSAPSSTASSSSTSSGTAPSPYAEFTDDLEDLTLSIILKPHDYAASVAIADGDWSLPEVQGEAPGLTSGGVHEGAGDADSYRLETSAGDGTSLADIELQLEDSAIIHGSRQDGSDVTSNSTMSPSSLIPRASAATLAQLRSRLTQRTTIVPSVSYDAATDSYLYEAERTRVERLEREADERRRRRREERKRAQLGPATTTFSASSGSSTSSPVSSAEQQAEAPKGSGPSVKRRPREAAVLIPLINVLKPDSRTGETELGILMQVRAGGMRMHAGEVR